MCTVATRYFESNLVYMQLHLLSILLIDAVRLKLAF